MATGTVWTRYCDFYRSSSYASFPQEHRESPGRLPFHMIMGDQVDHDFVDPSIPETLVSLPLVTSEGNSWGWNMGRGWHREAAVPGRMLVLPPDNVSQWEVRGARRILVLAIPSKTVRRILGPCSPDHLSDAFSPLSEKTWEDPFVQPLLTRLWEGTAGGHVTDRLLVDGALTTLVTHLLQRAGTIDRELRFIALPPWRLRRVYEFVDAHLHEEIDIVALAEVAGLSVRHFSRAFREEVGETPHRWLMLRRTEKATQLLARKDIALSQIAESCGFAGQSHFTKVFKQITGHTPKRWSSFSHYDES